MGHLEVKDNVMPWIMLWVIKDGSYFMLCMTGFKINLFYGLRKIWLKKMLHGENWGH